MKPLFDNVVIKQDEKKENKSGIIMPDSIETDNIGIVVAVGEGKKLGNNFFGESVPMDVKVGDKVMFKKYLADKLEWEGQEYLIVSEKDIIIII
jgi:chaperonin GroES